MPGAGLSWRCLGRLCATRQPSSRIGENPPYGMIGGIEETSASFEARSAPRSYPTEGLGVKLPGPTRQTRPSGHRRDTSAAAVSSLDLSIETDRRRAILRHHGA